MRLIEYTRKHWIKLLFVAVILFIVVPILIYLPSPMGIIPRNEAGNVLGYYGAVLGGAMTLGGVAWTIYDQNKQRKEELTLLYRPYLIFSDHPSGKGISGCYTLEPGGPQFTFGLKNVGNGIAKNIEITIAWPSELVSEDSQQTKRYSLISAQNYYLLSKIIGSDNIPQHLRKTFLIDVNCQYEDLFNNKIVMKCTISLKFKDVHGNNDIIISSPHYQYKI